jgi:hypothetical protein
MRSFLLAFAFLMAVVSSAPTELTEFTELSLIQNAARQVRLLAKQGALTDQESTKLDCGVCDLDFSKPKDSNDGRTTFLKLPPGIKITFGSICTVAGQTLDLILTTKSSWTTKFSQDKTVGTRSQTNVKSGTNVTWEFQLVSATTGQPVEVENAIFSVLDLDGWGKVVQQVKIDGFSTMIAGSGICQASTGEFVSMKDGNSTDNPTSTTDLTADQEDSVLSMNFKKVSGWQISMSIPQNVTGGRNFFIGGATKLMSKAAVCANTLKSTQLPVCQP